MAAATQAIALALVFLPLLVSYYTYVYMHRRKLTARQRFKIARANILGLTVLNAAILTAAAVNGDALTELIIYSSIIAVAGMVRLSRFKRSAPIIEKFHTWVSHGKNVLKYKIVVIDTDAPIGTITIGNTIYISKRLAENHDYMNATLLHEIGHKMLTRPLPCVLPRVLAILVAASTLTIYSLYYGIALSILGIISLVMINWYGEIGADAFASMCGLAGPLHDVLSKLVTERGDVVWITHPRTIRRIELLASDLEKLVSDNGD